MILSGWLSEAKEYDGFKTGDFVMNLRACDGYAALDFGRVSIILKDAPFPIYIQRLHGWPTLCNTIDEVRHLTEDEEEQLMLLLLSGEEFGRLEYY